MSAIILLNMDDADAVEIIDGEDGFNLVFENAEEADQWLQENAQVGWCTRIIDLDD